jgi:hypothetical protein
VRFAIRVPWKRKSMLLSLIASALVPVSPVEIIQRVVWTLTFAAQLVLLVVLIGRGRAPRFPWFTTLIAFTALRLMVEVLLAGRVAMIPFSVITLSMANLAVIVSILVLVEVARRSFAGLDRSLWLVNSIGLLIIGGGILAIWGPWPVWKNLAVETLLGKLRLMQLMLQKGELLVALLTFGLGLLVIFFGRHFKAGWRSHSFLIVIGLTCVAATSLALQGGLQIAVVKGQIHSRADFEKTSILLTTLQQITYLAALIWWISWLWQDEPGAPAQADSQPTQEPERIE